MQQKQEQETKKEIKEWEKVDRYLQIDIIYTMMSNILEGQHWQQSDLQGIHLANAQQSQLLSLLAPPKKAHFFFHFPKKTNIEMISTLKKNKEEWFFFFSTYTENGARKAELMR